jgi:hypothetical protein
MCVAWIQGSAADALTPRSSLSSTVDYEPVESDGAARGRRHRAAAGGAEGRNAAGAEAATGRGDEVNDRAGWEISANLGQHSRSGVDARGWLWEITRGEEVARVLIEVSAEA